MEELTRDPMLAMIIGWVNLTPDGSMSATLFCEGQVVTGRLVSAEAYWKRMSELMKGASGDAGAAEGVAALFEDLSHNLLLERIDPEREEEPEEVHHAHMLDATVVVGSMEGYQLAVWRGRVSSIGAWSLGEVVVGRG